ncbi:MAG: hypothetical protein AB3N28_13410, partial [Kordiimonas sp.]
MRKLFAVLCLFTLSITSSAQSADYIQMLNSYVSVRLHLDTDPKRGQMVGAAWLRIRNNGNTPLTGVPYILNPGLQVTKTLGPNNRPLRDNSNIASVSGYEYLDATVGTINLPTPLLPDSDMEIVIQYRGSLQNMSWSGIDHAKETLSSNFTVLRADSFAYPVIAAPTKIAIAAALSQPAYYQTATVEVADGYTVAGNLHVDEIALKGANKSYGLRYGQPSTPMVLPIANYLQLSEGPLSVSVFNGYQSAGSSLITDVTPLLTRLSNMLGEPAGNKLNITMVPDGYGTLSTSGLTTLEESNFSADKFNASEALLNLWGVGAQETAGHWRTSLDHIIRQSAANQTLSDEAAPFFSELKSKISTNKKLGKATLESLTVAKQTDEAEALLRLTFAGLHDIMGKDAFYEFVRALRTDLRGNYAD